MFEKFIVKRIKKYIKKKFLKYHKKGLVEIPKNLKTIKPKDLLTGDILLVLGSNPFTKFHGKYRDPKLGHLTHPPTHANLFYEHSETDHIIADTELRTTLSSLDEYRHKKIYVIRYNLDQKQIEQVRKFIKKAIIEERTYDWKGYGSFINDFPLPEWAKKIVAKIKPSKKTYFCSDFDASAYDGIMKVSSRPANESSPQDLLLYAIPLYNEKDLKLKFIKILNPL